MSSSEAQELCLDMESTQHSLSAEKLPLRILWRKNTDSPLIPDYLEKIKKEIDFLGKYAPFPQLSDFHSTLLRYLSSETRLGAKLPFSHIEVSLKGHILTQELSKFHVQKEQTRFGSVDILFTNLTFGVYRLRIAPRSEIPKHFHKIMEEKELILDEGILLNGRPTHAGTVHLWSHGEEHRYENSTDRELSILCIDQPPFDPQDEVEC